jgi:hypothetical protein
MSRDNVIIGADQNRICEAELAYRGRDAGDLLSAVGARVVRPRNKAFDRPALDLDVDVWGRHWRRFLSQARL